MRELVKATGIVLKVTPVGDFDRRLVLLTRERGKVTVFARGAKRPGSAFMAVSRPFVFGVFSLYEGKDAYNLQGAEVKNYFEDVTQDVESACYGSYFLEFADYYTRENADESDMIKLLYQSLRALMKPSIPNQLIWRVFELKAMMINGEYLDLPPLKVSDSATYTWEYVVASPVESLYRFTVTEEVLEEFSKCVELLKERYIDRKFHSLKILNSLL